MFSTKIFYICYATRIDWNRNNNDVHGIIHMNADYIYIYIYVLQFILQMYDKVKQTYIKQNLIITRVFPS